MLKKFMEQVKRTIAESKQGIMRIFLSLYLFLSSFFTFSITSYADGPTGKQVISRVVGLICKVGQFIGIGFVALAIISFLIAWAEDSNGKNKAIVFAIIGAVLIGLTPIMNAILGEGYVASIDFK